MKCRKIVLFITLIIFLSSCVKKSYDYTFIPSGSVWKGKMENGNTLYLIRDSIETTLSGKWFVENGNAIVNPSTFRTDLYGKAIFETSSSSIKGKLVALNNEENSITISLMSIPENKKRQKIKLLYEYTMGDIPIFENRFKDPIFDSILSFKNVKYGTAPGYYTSSPMNHVSKDDYSTIFKEIFNNFTQTVVKQGLVEQPLYMDIYYPYGDDALYRPLFIYLHGGAFMFGDKEGGLQEIFTEDLVRKGYVVISMNYRLGSTLTGFGAIERTIYRGVQDVRAALRYVTFYSERLRIDPDHIYLGGSSAGGIIALTTAFMGEENVYKSASGGIFNKDLGGLDFSGNPFNSNFKIAGVTSMWGAVTDLNMIKNHIPTLLFHGTDDDIVPYNFGLPFKNAMGDKIHNFASSSWGLYGSEAIYNYMNKQLMPVKKVHFPGYGHEPHVDNERTLNANMDTIIKELNQFLFNNIWNNNSYNIIGKTNVGKNEKPPVYLLSTVKDEVVTWNVSGGVVIDQSPQFVQIVWFNDTKEGVITAYIKDRIGLTVEKELRVINYE